jgi:hypothetical protein
MLVLRKVLGSVSMITMLTVLLLVGFYQTWLVYGAAGRIEPGLLERAAREGTIPAAIVLPFKPERFHIAKLQEEGRIRRVVGNVVELRSIDRDGIQALARRYYWIERINAL